MALPTQGNFPWLVIQGGEFNQTVVQAAAGCFKTIIPLALNTPVSVITSGVCAYFPALTVFNQITLQEISTGQTVGLAVAGGTANLAESVQLGPGGGMSFGGANALPASFNLQLLNPVTNSTTMEVELIITGS